jgi:AcrR family transcriptional regulator
MGIENLKDNVKDGLKDTIIQKARQMFEQYGLRSVSIDNVCRDLSISKKTFYNYFQQKEDLVDEVILAIKHENISRFSKQLKDKNAIDSLIFIIKEIKKSEDCEPPTMWFDFEKYYPKLFAVHEKQKMEFIRNGFEHNLRQGISEGYYRDDLDIELTSYFHSVQLKTTFEMMQSSDLKFAKRRVLDFFIDMLIHLIANEKGLLYLKENYLEIK